MINEISCEICRDLIPLVKDGVASEESETAVREHTSGCAECAALFDGKAVPNAPEQPNALKRVKRQLNCIYIALMVLGLYVGLSVTSSMDAFYNILIMPVAGVLGYLAFRWKAVFIVPIILLAMNVITNALGLFSAERLGFSELMTWTIIYILFIIAGVVIATLFRFAFGKHSSGKENKNER